MSFDFTSLIGPAVGGLFGALGSSNANQQNSSQTQTLDPRMAGAVYGNLVPGLTNYYQQNQSGLNPVMTQGLNQQYNTLQDPFSAAGYGLMGQRGYQLMGGSVAGNPFTMGQNAPSGPSGVPAAPSGPTGWGQGGLGIGGLNSFGPFGMPAPQSYSGAPASSPMYAGGLGFGMAQPNPNVGHAGSTNTPSSAWGAMSPAQQASFYSQNPTYAAITQALQAGLGYTALGQLQSKLAPSFVAQQAMIANGINPMGVVTNSDGSYGTEGSGPVDGGAYGGQQNGGWSSFNAPGGAGGIGG